MSLHARSPVRFLFPCHRLRTLFSDRERYTYESVSATKIATRRAIATSWSRECPTRSRRWYRIWSRTTARSWLRSWTKNAAVQVRFWGHPIWFVHPFWAPGVLGNLATGSRARSGVLENNKWQEYQDSVGVAWYTLSWWRLPREFICHSFCLFWILLSYNVGMYRDGVGWWGTAVMFLSTSSRNHLNGSIKTKDHTTNGCWIVTAT